MCDDVYIQWFCVCLLKRRTEPSLFGIPDKSIPAFAWLDRGSITHDKSVSELEKNPLFAVKEKLWSTVCHLHSTYQSEFALCWNFPRYALDQIINDVICALLPGEWWSNSAVFSRYCYICTACNMVGLFRNKSCLSLHPCVFFIWLSWDILASSTGWNCSKILSVTQRYSFGKKCVGYHSFSIQESKHEYSGSMKIWLSENVIKE